jgi:hypothetical protein
MLGVVYRRKEQEREDIRKMMRREERKEGVMEG